MNLVSRWHGSLPIVDHTFSCLLSVPRAIVFATVLLDAAAFDGGRVVMHLPDLVHGLVLVGVVVSVVTR